MVVKLFNSFTDCFLPCTVAAGEKSRLPVVGFGGEGKVEIATSSNVAKVTLVIREKYRPHR